MQQQSQSADNSLAKRAEQTAYHQTLDENITASWDDLKDSLYMYSICAQQQLKQYESDLVRQTEVFHSYLEGILEFNDDLH